MKQNRLQQMVLSLVALFTFVGCETTVEFRGEYTEPLAVLNSVVTAGEPVRVYYAKSTFILANEPQTNYIDGATVELYINDLLVETLSPASETNQWGEKIRFYSGNLAPRAADKVTLRARSEEFPEWVSATVTVPHDVAVGELRIEEQGIEEGTNYHYGTATLEITDPEGMENYYWVMGQTLCRNEQGGDFPPNGRRFEYTDVAFTEGNADDALGGLLGASTGNNITFNDTLLEGQGTYPLTMEWDVSDTYIQRDVLFEVMCYQMDENLYKYIRSMELAGSDLAMFGEPVQVHSNVEGGIGVVGARSRVVTLQKLYSERGE